MQSMFRRFHRYGSIACVGATLLIGVLVPSGAALGADSEAFRSAFPGRISAKYKISLGGFDLGHFTFDHRLQGDSYALRSVVELSALLGVIRWRGVTYASGKFVTGKPYPEDFAFDYKSNAESGFVRMRLADRQVLDLAANPPSPVTGDWVPLQGQHVKDVLDPLSAILVLSHAPAGNPCGRNVPIFDGKQRFDLRFSFRRNERLAPTMQGTVCQVKYVPIGGYPANAETRSLAAENNIEIAFRPIAERGLMVPYWISLPTVIGTARLELDSLSIMSGQDRVASAR